MKPKKLLMSAVLIITMVLSGSVGVFAQADEVTNVEKGGIEEIETINEFNFEKMSGIDSPEVSVKSKSSIMSGDNILDINEGYDSMSLNSPRFMRSAKMTSKAVTRTWTEKLEKQGDYKYYFATLDPGQMFNATLICPKNPDLNYNLLVYDIDNEGRLRNLVAGSTTETYFNTYPDGSKKTIDEGVSYVNKTSTTNQYAIIVSAVKGGSSTDEYQLTLSLDVKGNYDSAEPNDSAYSAYSINDKGISDVSLHVKNDQDWYIWKTKNEFKSAKLTVSKNYKAEMYTADGNKIVLSEKNPDGSYKIADGVNYIKVYSDSTSFEPAEYTLNIEPCEMIPATMEVVLDGDQGKNSYPDYPEGHYFRFKDKFSPKVKLLTVNGHPVKNYPVTLRWESGSWKEQTGNKVRTITGITNDKGEVELVLETPNLPTSLGLISLYLKGPMQFMHHYDIDGIIISAPGVKPYTNVVYHFSHSEYIGN